VGQANVELNDAIGPWNKLDNRSELLEYMQPSSTGKLQNVLEMVEFAFQALTKLYQMLKKIESVLRYRPQAKYSSCWNGWKLGWHKVAKRALEKKA
jgi:hypothetical protein